MDEIKTKLRGFLQKHKSDVKIPQMGFSESFNYHDVTVPEAVSPTKSNEAEESCPSDQQILDDIEEEFYDEEFNSASYEVNNLAKEEITEESLVNLIKYRKQQHNVISKMVLQKILEKQAECNVEIGNIKEIETNLKEALVTCKNSRSCLAASRNNLTSSSLEILAAYRKRHILVKLLESIKLIKNIKTTEDEVQKLLETKNYSSAIQLLLKCRHSTTELSQFECVNSLQKKYQEMLMFTEYQIDQVMSEITLRIDINTYAELQKTYKILNKSIIVMDQIHINFISTIHLTLNNILRSYCDIPDKPKLLFEQLCENIPSEHYIPCLLDICKSFWSILSSYYQIVMWHQNFKLFEDDLTSNSPDIYFQQKLQGGQDRIWCDVQSKISTYLSFAGQKKFKYEKFIQIISIVHKLKKIGNELFNLPATKLMETIQHQSLEFFRKYHISCLEEICLFLDNESWESVETLSNIAQLQEFKNLRLSHLKQRSDEFDLNMSDLQENLSEKNIYDDLTSFNSHEGSTFYESCSYFNRYAEKGSPFDVLEDDAVLITTNSNDNSFDLPNENDENSNCNDVNTLNNSFKNTQMSINATCLNILRCIGRYIHMCRLLRLISNNIILAMWELVDFYVYVVNEVFTKDSIVDNKNLYSKNLTMTLNLTEKNVLPKIQMWPLNFSSLISNELSNPETMFGLTQRILSIQSGICLIHQLETLNPYFKALLPPEQHNILETNKNYIEILNEISLPVFICSTSRVIDLKGILNTMAKVRWDVNHVSVHHSSYVDTINRNIQKFAMLLEEISSKIQIPSQEIWESLAHVVTHLMVEGFSNAKNCSAAGRALMQLDFTDFMSIFELISGMKFHSYRTYVDAFVKAYYYPSDIFTEWIEQQKDCKTYSKNQLTNLISCVCARDRRTKQKLLDLIETTNSINNI